MRDKICWREQPATQTQTDTCTTRRYIVHSREVIKQRVECECTRTSTSAAGGILEGIIKDLDLDPAGLISHPNHCSG